MNADQHNHDQLNQQPPSATKANAMTQASEERLARLERSMAVVNANMDRFLALLEAHAMTSYYNSKHYRIRYFLRL